MKNFCIVSNSYKDKELNLAKKTSEYIKLKGGKCYLADNVEMCIRDRAMEVDGVLAMAGNITAEIVARLGMKKLSKGVRVKVDENTVVIDLSIVLRMNENIVKISNKVQDKVKTTVENMTGMEVAGVNVNISNVLSN